MKIDIGSIREVRGGSLNFQGKEALDGSNLDLEIKLTGPVNVKGRVTNTGEGFLLEAELDYSYEASCGRCLESYQDSQHVQIREQFATYTPNDDLLFQFNGEQIDLTDCIREQVLLSLPMTYVCNSGCRGLCAGCGKNLNSGSCGCVKEEINPQFSKLKTLLSKEGGGVDGQSEE